jgi:hypothetical protein
VTTVGVTAAVIWEFYELVVELLRPAFMVVGYVDTVVDLLAGLLGSLAAGGLVLLWGRRQESRTTYGPLQSGRDEAGPLRPAAASSSAPSSPGSGDIRDAP